VVPVGCGMWLFFCTWQQETATVATSTAAVRAHPRHPAPPMRRVYGDHALAAPLAAQCHPPPQTHVGGEGFAGIGRRGRLLLADDCVRKPPEQWVAVAGGDARAHVFC
jgi:hypothetical protein